MHVFLFIIIFFIARTVIRSLGSRHDQEHDNTNRYGSNRWEDRKNQQSQDEAQEAYRRWQEEIYRRYRESQNQYREGQFTGQNNGYSQYGGYSQGAYNGYQNRYGGYQNTSSPRPYDPKKEEVRRMYGHPRTLDELDDRQRELRKKYHPDNNNGDSSMFILVDQVHDEIERNMRY